MRKLVSLRGQLYHAMQYPDNGRLEALAASCHEIGMPEPRALRAHLRALDQPRRALTQLTVVLASPTLAPAPLQRALAAASECVTEGTAPQELRTLWELGGDVLDRLVALANATANGRRAHAHLLVAADHHTAYIGQVEQAVEDLQNALERLPPSPVSDPARSSSRASSPGPSPEWLQATQPGTTDTEQQHQGPGQAVVDAALELVARWRREEGPAQLLKVALATSDIARLREAVAAAQEAGLATRAARKQLVRLEATETAAAALQAAVVAGVASAAASELRGVPAPEIIATLRTAVATARGLELDCEHARGLLREWTALDAVRIQLSAAISANREDLLAAAVTAARDRGLDASVAEAQLAALVQQRLASARQRDEARRQRLQSLADELVQVSEDPDVALGTLADRIRAARTNGVDVSRPLQALQRRVDDQLLMAMAQDRDCARLTAALRTAGLLEGLGTTVDLGPARARLAEWQSAVQVEDELQRGMALVAACPDDTTVPLLASRIEAARSKPSVMVDTLAAASAMLHRGQALLRVRNALRLCRVAHENACAHPLVAAGESPEQVAGLARQLDAAADAVPASEAAEIRRLLVSWTREAELTGRMRQALADRNADGLLECVATAQRMGAGISLDAPRRAAERLIAQRDRELRAVKLAASPVLSRQTPTRPTAPLQTAAKPQPNPHTSPAARRPGAAPGMAGSRQRTQSLRETLPACDSPGPARRSPPRHRASSPAPASRNSFPAQHRSTPVALSAHVPHTSAGLSSSEPRHPRYKTALCSHWLAHGACAYGRDQCNFAHGDDDLRTLPVAEPPASPPARDPPSAPSSPAPSSPGLRTTGPASMSPSPHSPHLTPLCLTVCFFKYMYILFLPTLPAVILVTTPQ